MTTETIKILRDAPAFKWMEIHLTSGKTIRIPHRDFLFIPRFREDVIIVEEQGGPFQIIDINNIEKIDWDKNEPS